MKRVTQVIVAGWLGGFAGNAFLGAIFSSPWIKNVLYDPAWQSRLFLAITPQRDIAVSVVGLVVLSGLHGLFFHLFRSCIPGQSTFRKGLFWGLVIWATYWLFQEWFIYITLLHEPVALALVELAILLIGSLIEGVVIALVVEKLTDRP
ncbi:MAG: hypothetical protein ACOY9D_01740 [Pseudomonadota bacterium]